MQMTIDQARYQEVRSGNCLQWYEADSSRDHAGARHRRMNRIFTINRM